MRVTRIYSDSEGVSHLEDLDVALAPTQYAPPADPIDVSEPFAASRAVFFSIPAGYVGDWHPTPRRQLYYALSGRLEVEVSDGQRRTFHPGEVALVEDEVEPGHVTRAVGDEPATGAFVHLDRGGPVRPRGNRPGRRRVPPPESRTEV